MSEDLARKLTFAIEKMIDERLLLEEDKSYYDYRSYNKRYNNNYKPAVDNVKDIIHLIMNSHSHR